MPDTLAEAPAEGLAAEDIPEPAEASAAEPAAPAASPVADEESAEVVVNPGEVRGNLNTFSPIWKLRGNLK